MDHNEDLIPEEPIQLPANESQTETQPDPQLEPQVEIPAEPDVQPEETAAEESAPVEPVAPQPTPTAENNTVIHDVKIHPQPGRKARFLRRRIISAIVCVALIIASCAVTASLVNSHWEDRTAELTASMEDQLDEIENGKAII